MSDLNAAAMLALAMAGSMDSFTTERREYRPPSKPTSNRKARLAEKAEARRQRNEVSQ